MDADVNIESVYSSSLKYFQWARMYETWEAINREFYLV